MSENQSTPDDAQRPDGEPGFSFTDKRKYRGETGAESDAAPASGAEQDANGREQEIDPIDAEASELFAQAKAEEDSAHQARISELEAQVAEAQENLKREQAEYVNSRRRIEASAKVDIESAKASVLSSLFSVLDDITLARQHGDVEEGSPFAAITQKLEDVLRGQGLDQYGAAGEEFDPNIHDALMHRADADAEATVIEHVIQPGYRWNDRVLRPARVGTVGPE